MMTVKEYKFKRYSKKNLINLLEYLYDNKKQFPEVLSYFRQWSKEIREKVQRSDEMMMIQFEQNQRMFKNKDYRSRPPEVLYSFDEKQRDCKALYRRLKADMGN